MVTFSIRRGPRRCRTHAQVIARRRPELCQLRSIMAAEQELPLFLGLNDKSITDIPKTVEKQRYMTSVAPKASNPGKWVEQPRMPIPTGEHAVIECQGKIDRKSTRLNSSHLGISYGVF